MWRRCDLLWWPVIFECAYSTVYNSLPLLNHSYNRTRQPCVRSFQDPLTSNYPFRAENHSWSFQNTCVWNPPELVIGCYNSLSKAPCLHYQLTSVPRAFKLNFVEEVILTQVVPIKVRGRGLPAPKLDIEGSQVTATGLITIHSPELSNDAVGMCSDTLMQGSIWICKNPYRYSKCL
jgi:hypothetical protein